MENQQEMMPRWELMSHLISDVLQDDELLLMLQEFSSQQKIEYLHNYGFTDDDLTFLGQDLNKLSGSIMGLGHFWF